MQRPRAEGGCRVSWVLVGIGVGFVSLCYLVMTRDLRTVTVNEQRRIHLIGDLSPNCSEIPNSCLRSPTRHDPRP